MCPERDYERSRELDLLFEVATRSEGQAWGWETFVEGLELEHALQVAGATAGYEVAVITSEGLVYWTSLEPARYRSSSICLLSPG